MNYCPLFFWHSNLALHLAMVRLRHNPLLKCAIDQQEEDDTYLRIHEKNMKKCVLGTGEPESTNGDVG